MSIYDRRFGAPPGSVGGGSFMNLPPGNLAGGAGSSSGGNGGASLMPMASNNNGGPSTPLNGPSLLSNLNLGNTNSSASHSHSQHSQQQGRPDSSGGPPLLLNNLAQHLNNPPAPGSSHSHSTLGGMSHTGLGGLNVGMGGQGQGQVQGHGQGIGMALSPIGGMSANSNAGHGHGQAQGQGQGQGHYGGMTSLNSLASLGDMRGMGGMGSMGSMANMAGMAGLMNPHGMQGQQPVKLLLLPNGAPPPAGSEEEKIYEMITELLDPNQREQALLELSKKREMYEDLALVLWGGFGVMSSLLLEIVNVYPALSPPSLTAHASNRVCNALALLQCVASHSETRSLFLNAHIPLFLYPFLNTTSKTRPFEYLRLTSLGVIGALVKQNDNSDVINFLLSTEIIPLCLRIMETGSELSKTVAIFIVQKILLDDLGLQYICQTYERFYAVGAVLGNMVATLVETQAVRLLKHVVRCYLRMSDNPRAREALRACLPDALQNGSFNVALKGDQVTKRCLSTLLANLNDRSNE